MLNSKLLDKLDGLQANYKVQSTFFNLSITEKSQKNYLLHLLVLNAI